MRALARDLPDDLALPLASGADWWYWLGGRPAMDLVNTLRERWQRRVETLASTSDLGEWLVQAELLSEPPRVSRALLDDARDLREAIDLCVEAVLARHEFPSGAVAHIDGWLLDAGARPRLAIGADGQPRLGERAPADPARAAVADIALDAARMLGTDEVRRVRICASATCSARFYDRSPAAQRRWCSMATCGNEAKARRHRARVRAA